MTTEIKNIELLEQLKEYGFGRDSLNIMKAFEGIPDFTIKTEVGEYRFIHEDVIKDTLKNELSAEVIILGSFEASFIADILNIPLDSVMKLQKAKHHEMPWHQPTLDAVHQPICDQQMKLPK